MKSNWLLVGMLVCYYKKNPMNSVRLFCIYKSKILEMSNKNRYKVFLKKLFSDSGFSKAVLFL